MMGEDEFYIGYEGGMPPRMRRAVCGAIVVAVTAAIGAAALFVSQQQPLVDARFEFGHVRTFEGYLSLTPAPVLLVRDRDTTQPHWLVSPGKYGPSVALGTAAPGWVTLAGTLIERERWRMIEIVHGSLRARDSRAPPPAVAAPTWRERALTGEIVDSKCFLGVMNPGERTVHRDCATRCLSGGVPAMLAYRDDTGPHLALLLGADADVLRQGVGNTVTLPGLLSGPEESQVFAIGGRVHSLRKQSRPRNTAGDTSLRGWHPRPRT